MRTIITLTPLAKLELTALADLTQQSEGRIISNLITQFGDQYLEYLEKKVQKALDPKSKGRPAGHPLISR